MSHSPGDSRTSNALMTARSTRQPGRRVMLIGLDCADADLIEQWCKEGCLPNLQLLRLQGSWGTLRTTAEVMHVSAWPSIYTGTTPGQHGMYHAYQIKPGEQGVHRTRADAYGQPPFWHYLDEAGKRCIVLDAFMNYPLKGFHGIQILEYGTWTWFSEPLATPAGLWHEMIRTWGPYPVPEHAKVLGMPEPHQFRNQLIAGAALKAKVVGWLMRQTPWDLFFVTLAEPHPAGHYLWHLSDPVFPAHPSGGIVGLEQALRDVYMAVDGAIGEIIRALDDSVSIVVISGDGMGPNYAGSHLMPEVLHRLGLYDAAGVGQQHDSPSGRKQRQRQKKSLVSAVRDRIPWRVRRVISHCIPRHLQHRLSMKWANANIDWSRTKAFCIPNANEAYIRVNMQGREPWGTVPRGAAYAELVAEMQQRLQELVNPENGRVAARQVVCTDSLFPGARRDHLPDVVVTWDIEAAVQSALQSNRCGLVSGRAAYETAPFYTGNHRPSAFVLGRGPGIGEGAVLPTGHVVDLAPTIMAMLGVDPPRHLDGRVWQEFLG